MCIELRVELFGALGKRACLLGLVQSLQSEFRLMEFELYLSESLVVVRRGGRQVALASIGDGRVSFDLPDFFHELLHLVGIDTFKLEGEKIVRLMNSIKTGFEEGKLFPADVHEWELETAREAYSAVSKGTAGTRQVFVFD